MKDISAISSDLLSGMTVPQIVQKLRKLWSSYPKKFAAMYRNSERVKLPDGKIRTFIKCARCLGMAPKHLIEMHHKQPVGKLHSNSEADVAAYTKRMFPPVNGIEPMCRLCHLQVSNQNLSSKQPFKGTNNVSIN